MMFKQLERELKLLGYGNLLVGSNNDKHSKSPVTPDKIIDWVPSVRVIKNQAFSFENREYLRQIYEDPAKEIYIVKPRQMEITEFALNFLLYNLTKNTSTVGLYLTDRQDHVSVFSKLRLHSWGIDQSKILKSMVPKMRNVSWQPFTNGSHLWMYSAWPDFEKARSIPADFVVVDEIQSTNVEAIPVLRESLSKSRFGRFVGIGTGSIRGDDWYKRWHMGNQQHWDPITKKWIPKNPSSKISSYHITQYVASWITREEIEQKRLTYTPRRFANEVEGWWYGSTSKPITEENIRPLFDHSKSLVGAENVEKDRGPIYLGVDWGGGTKAYTVVWIWQLLDENAPRFQLLYISRIDEKSVEKQAEMVAKLIEDYDIDLGIVDSGGGSYQVQKLEEKYFDKIIKCVYMVRPEDPFEIQYEENKLKVDRTWVIETIIDLITRPEINASQTIPRMVIPALQPEKIEWLIDDFTCIEAESVTLSSGKRHVKYIKPEEQNDDALHACIFAYLAWLVKRESSVHWISA